MTSESTPLELPLSTDKLTTINDYLRTLDPPKILEWAVNHLPQLYQTTAFGLTGLVAIDILSKIDVVQPPLIFIDTLYHFPETYALVGEVEKRYGLKVNVFKPEGCETVSDFERKWGEQSWERDEGTYDFAVKVEPAQRAYQELNVRAVITGRRASQGADRASLEPLEVDEVGLVKLNPLFGWKLAQVEEYIQTHKVPRNKLLDEGYKSVGDWHSTIKSGEGDAGERAGRWADKESKTECGLHKDYFAMKANATTRDFVLSTLRIGDRMLLALIRRFSRSHLQDIMPLTAPLLSPTFTDDHPFPSLPPIHDDDIRARVFTHRSFYARPNHVFEDQPDDPSPDNEKYEHLGDSVLGLIVTRLLFDMYPTLHVGPSTKIRALVVGNPTLAAISRRYALPAQLELHPAQAITLMTSPNIQADVFESYVGGLYLDQGLSTVEEWLKLLFKPYTYDAYIRVRTQHGLPPPSRVSPPLAPSPSVSSADSSSSESAPSTSASEGSRRSITHRHPHRHPHATGTPTTTGHLALFNQQLQKARLDFEWMYDDCDEGTTTTPIWAVRIEVNGEVYGRGRGSTKKAARNEAAKEGLVRMGIDV